MSSARAAALFLLTLVAVATAADKPRLLKFSGYRWHVKQSDAPVGPEPNYFSGSEEDVWADKDGRLHLKILQRGGQWRCTEV